MKWWFNQKMHIKIFVCIVIGIILGVTLGEKASILNPLGEVFLRLLKMLIVPLTFFTIVSGITKMEDIKSLRSVGGRIGLYYILSSLFAATTGMVMALIIRPGKEVVGILDQGVNVEVTSINFLENVISWIPTNPIESLVSGNMLQIIFFSVFMGIALLLLGQRVKKLNEIIDQSAETMIKITDMVMKFAPYGILALIAEMVGTLGAQMLAEVGKFILTDYLALSIMLFVVYPLLLKYIGKLRPIQFYRAIAPAMLVAASTTSSAATLPISMNVADKNLKIPEKIYGFTLPLGATVNMDGMAVALGVISVFAANVYDLPITVPLMLQFMFLGLILSIGAAGVKGAGIVMSTILLQTLNLPLTLVPIFAAIWPIIDIGHTTTNITGDLAGTALVAANIGEIDVDSFNNSVIGSSNA